MVVIIVFAIVIVAAGAAAGTIVLVSWGIRREERDFSLVAREAPDRLSRGTRLITGLYVRRRMDSSPSQARRPDIFA
jgi:hypothetical protein